MSAALLLALAGCGDEVDCEEFTVEAGEWRTSDDRGQLADALVECRTLVGRRRPEVRRLLGRPAEGGRESELYVVGPDALKLDDEVLVVTYGPNERVTGTDVVVP